MRDIDMRLTRLKSLALLVILSFVSSGWVQETTVTGERYAMIIGGLGGQKEYSEKYLIQTTHLLAILVDTLQYKRENITYLFEDTAFDSLNIDGVSSAENIRQAFRDLSHRMKKQDQLFVFMTGHGSYDGKWSKFNLVGKDLRDIEYAQLLSELPTKRIIVVNTSSASGPFIRRLSGEKRVIITATKSGAQEYETNFADFFLQALATEQADLDKDKRVSMTEVFAYARGSQDNWFEDKQLLRAEHPLLDDNGDGVGSQQVDGNGSDDGLWASRVFLSPPARDVQRSLEKINAGTATPRDKLILRKEKIEEEIADLKARKSQLAGTEYDRQLESLLVELAKLNRQLKEPSSGQ